MDLSSIGNVLGALKGLGGGGSKATSNSTSSASATNALNLTFNPVLANDVGSALWPTTGGDAYGNPSSSATATGTASPSDTNPSSMIPWYYPGGTGTYDVGAYKGTTGSGTYATGTSSQSSMVLFMMMGIALIFLMKGK